jgi:hypothetical protein
MYLLIRPIIRLYSIINICMYSRHILIRVLMEPKHGIVISNILDPMWE